MTSHTRRVLELGVGLGLALTLVLTALADWHQRTAARVRADTIRLHILANSDTWDDQLLKLPATAAGLSTPSPEACACGPSSGGNGGGNRVGSASGTVGTVSAFAINSSKLMTSGVAGSSSTAAK